MRHDHLVLEIKNLPWEKFKPKGIIQLSLETANEFAASLRCAEKVYPDNADLKKMIAEELKTDNLNYGGYSKKGDHWEFLFHFFEKASGYSDLSDVCRLRNYSIETYHKKVSAFDNAQRAMTIFSRETELPGIFSKIIKAHDWDSLGLGFYKYYLERHIELDSQSGGHGDLTKGFEMDEDVLFKFYTARRDLYRILEV